MVADRRAEIRKDFVDRLIEIRKDIAVRLIEIREDLGYQQNSFSKLIDIKNTTYCNYENGVSAVPLYVQVKLVEFFDISIDWLITGKGSKYLGTEERKAKERPSLDSLLTTKEELETKADKTESERLRQELQSTQTQLADTQAQLNELKSVVYREHNLPDEKELVEPEVELPDYGLVAAAGPAQELDAQRQIEDTYAVRESLLPRNREGLFVGRIEGGSMADIIPSGSRLLLRVCKEPLSGRVYVFTLRGCATIKKFQIDYRGPHFEYMDGSGRSIYPEPGEQWYCNAEFLRVIN